MSRASRLSWMVVAVLALASPDAFAQFAAPAGRFEVGGGIDWLGGSTLGAPDATETTAGGSSTRLFSSSTRIDSAPAFAVRFGVRLSRRLEAEALASFAKPTLATTVTNDIESSNAVTATETLTQYHVGGGALWYIPSRSLQRRWPRLRVFADGGAAFLRQLHEPNTLAVNGQAFHVGGGVKYWFSPKVGKRLKGSGLRGDVRLLAERKGVGFDTNVRYSPALGISLFARF